ncbi:MAG: hypothetical protein L0227_01495, partial [Chloroflexi bacterium]|nr:hypothetical protein [Chloroflexota bacterium]
ASAWVSFGSDPDAPDEIDLRVRSNVAPVLDSIGQFLSPDDAEWVLGETVHDASAVIFNAEAYDDDGDAVTVEIEVRPIGFPFEESATVSLPMAALQLPAGAYRWRYRAVDSFDGLGSWFSFGGNPEGDADFVIRMRGASFNAGAGCAAHGGAQAGLAAALAFCIAAFLRSRSR